MFRISLSYLSAFLLSFCSVLPAWADSEVCHDSIKAICSDRIPTPKDKLAKQLALQVAGEVNYYLSEKYPLEGYVETLRKELHDRPLKYGLVKSERTIFRAMLYMGCSEYLARAYFSNEIENPKCFTQPYGPRKLTYQDLFAPLGDPEQFKKPNQVIQEAKALVEQVLNESALDSRLKDLLVKRVESTGHMSVLNSIREDLKNADKKELAHMPGKLADMIESCDFDEADTNAFNYGTGDQSDLIVCPSFWVTNMRAFGNGDETAGLMILTHEMGHSVEGAVAQWQWGLRQTQPAAATQFQEMYKGVLSCMQMSFVDTGELSTRIPEDTQGAKRAEFIKKMNFKINEKTTRLFYSEYSADVISAKSMARYLERVPTPEQRVMILKRNLDFLCGDSEHEELNGPKLDDNILHPSGDFRIKNTFLGTPELRNALSCDTQSVPKSCSIF